MKIEEVAKETIRKCMDVSLASAHDGGRGWSEGEREGWAPIAAALAAAQQEARAAALEERDGEWKAACKHAGNATPDGWLWCGNCDSEIAPIELTGCRCEWSATLRALLEGK